jgi:GMP synthase (glutamine-hydrolysing)
MRILIVDSNPSALNDQIAAAGTLPLGQGYARAVQACGLSVECEICAPYDHDAVPDIAEFDGVIFSGSNVEWVASDARAAPLARIMRRAFDVGRPVFGSCNGMQLAAHVLGGSCDLSPNGREDGLAHDIEVKAPDHPMIAGRAGSYIATCVHRDEVTQLPAGATLVAGNAHSGVQAFAFEKNGVRFWGTQYHPEYDVKDVSAILAAGSGLNDNLRAELQAYAGAADLADPRRLNELRNWLHSL